MRKLNPIAFIVLTLMIIACAPVSKVNTQVSRFDQVRMDFCKANVGDLREHLFCVRLEGPKSNFVLKGEVGNDSLKEVFVRKLQEEGFRVKDEVRVLPDSAVGKYCWGLIDLSAANLRSAPRHSAEMGTQVLLGTPVKVFDKKGSWYQVQTPDKYIAWVDAAGISLKTEAELNQWKTCQRIIATMDYSYVYDESLSESAVVSDLVMGDILQVESGDSDRWKVVFPDGRAGFVKKADARDFDEWCESIHPSSEELIVRGKSFLGRPYLWGGTSPKAMDCSGFVKTLYYNSGVVLARDASLQTKHGELVKSDTGWSELQPGDLVFFGKPSKEGQSEHVSHVGMYIGDSEFIHSAGKVKINSFDSKRANYSNYRSVSLIRGRRVLSSLDTEGITLIQHHNWYFAQ